MLTKHRGAGSLVSSYLPSGSGRPAGAARWRILACSTLSERSTASLRPGTSFGQAIYIPNSEHGFCSFRDWRRWALWPCCKLRSDLDVKSESEANTSHFDKSLRLTTHHEMVLWVLVSTTFCFVVRARMALLKLRPSTSEHSYHTCSVSRPGELAVPDEHAYIQDRCIF